MSEPNSALTFRTLVLEVAEKLRVCEYASTGVRHVPTDLFNLDICKRYVNNGIRMFMADRPKNGWRWMRRICSVTTAATITGTATAGSTTTLTDSGLSGDYAADYFNGYYLYITAGTGIGESILVTDYTAAGVFTFAARTALDTTTEYSICPSANAINGDGARYMLPANFGGMVDGPIKYAANSNHAIDVQWCDESVIRARRAVTVNSGYPALAAVRAYQPTSETLTASRRWELIIDPRPTGAYVIEFPYTLYFDKMNIFSGTATGASTTTVADTTNRTEPDDYFIGMIAYIVAGTGVDSYATVTDSAKTGGVITVADWLNLDGTAGGTDPVTGSIYVIEPAANLHPAGFQFDDAILAACLARTEMESQDQHADTFWSEYYMKKALPSAYAIDARSGPRKLGNMSGNNGPVRERTWLDVTTSHDV
jgi:hypothetical protein